VTDQTDESSTPKKRSLVDQFLKPKKQRDDVFDDYADGIIPLARRKEAMQSLNGPEQRMGYIAAALALFFGGLATLIFPHNRTVTTKPTNGHCPAGYGLVKGTCEGLLSNNLWLIVPIVLVFAVAIFVTVRIKRRTPTVFASFITGIALASFGIEVGAPFLIYGGWLMMRARRIQKYGTTDAKEVAALAGAERAARKAGQPSPLAKSNAKASEGTAKGTKASAATAAKSAPDPSGRYTPKAPTKKKAPSPSEKKPSRWRAKLEGLDQES
jgi:hypothetical protein